MITKEKLHLYYDVNEAGCWIWNKGYYSSGYGRFHGVNAHRVSWRLCCGAVPKGLFVLHKCDVKACINPEHLFLGNQRANLQDMAQKGRHGRSVLTAAVIPSIREAIKQEELTSSRMAACIKVGKQYGVSRGAIESILDGRSWIHAR